MLFCFLTHKKGRLKTSLFFEELTAAAAAAAAALFVVVTFFATAATAALAAGRVTHLLDDKGQGHKGNQSHNDVLHCCAHLFPFFPQSLVYSNIFYAEANRQVYRRKEEPLIL